MMLCDFHLHSTFSDGRLSIAEIVDLYGRRGFGAIAITDHLCEERTFLGKAARFLDRTLTRKTFPRYLEVLHEQAERAWHQYGMRVITGFELTKNALINKRSAHIVVLGVSEFISADQEIHALLQQVRDLGGLSIAAHPVNTGMMEPQTHYLWSRREELRQEFDAWEVASGPHLFQAVAESGLPMIANSDMHHPRQLKSWKTKLRCAREQEAIFTAIRKQEVDFRFYA
jgi:hypothetical protein